MARQGIDFLELTFDLGIELALMVVVVGECGVDLGQGEMRVLEVHLLGTAAVRELLLAVGDAAAALEHFEGAGLSPK